MSIICAAKGRWAALLAAFCVFAACGTEPKPWQPPDPAGGPSQDPELTERLKEARARLLAQPDDLALCSEFAMLLDANAIDQSAQEVWQQVTRLDPTSARAWYHLSRVSEQIGDSECSIEAIERCVEVEPNYGPAQARLGRLLEERGEYQRAEEAFRAAIRLEPLSPRGGLGLARLSLGRGDADGAIQALAPVLSQNPREPNANALMARALLLKGEHQQAEAHLAAEEHAGPASGADRWSLEVKQRAVGSIARLSRAKALLGRGDARAALEEIQPLLDRGQAEQAVVETLCEIRMALGQPEKVLMLLDQTEAGFLQAYSLLLYRARAQRAEGDQERALEAAQKALALNPRRLEAAALSGQILFDLERPDEALSAFLLARQNGDESLQTLAFVGRSRALVGDIKAGLRDIQEATAAYPSAPKPWAYLAELLAMDGRHPEARAALEQAQYHGLDALLAQRTRARLAELELQDQ